MAAHVMFDNVETARKNFVRNGLPYYVISDSKNEILWKNEEEEDLESAADLMKEDLELIRDYNQAIYTIKQYKKVPTGGLKKNSDPDCISTFKKSLPREDKQEYYQNRNMMVAGLGESLTELKNEIALLKAEISGIEEDPDGNLENEMTEIPWYHKIGEVVVNHPQFGNFITNILANLSTSLFTPSPAPQKLAGTNISNMTEKQQQEALQAAISLLFSKGVTLEHIIKLSEMPENKIKLLLTML